MLLHLINFEDTVDEFELPFREFELPFQRVISDGRKYLKRTSSINLSTVTHDTHGERVV